MIPGADNIYGYEIVTAETVLRYRGNRIHLPPAVVVHNRQLIIAGPSVKNNEDSLLLTHLCIIFYMLRSREITIKRQEGIYSGKVYKSVVCSVEIVSEKDV